MGLDDLVFKEQRENQYSLSERCREAWSQVMKGSCFVLFIRQNEKPLEDCEQSDMVSYSLKALSLL